MVLKGVRAHEAEVAGIFPGFAHIVPAAFRVLIRHAVVLALACFATHQTVVDTPQMHAGGVAKARPERRKPLGLRWAGLPA
jgi:hypothetical protein